MAQRYARDRTRFKEREKALMRQHWVCADVAALIGFALSMLIAVLVVITVPSHNIVWTAAPHFAQLHSASHGPLISVEHYFRWPPVRWRLRRRRRRHCLVESHQRSRALDGSGESDFAGDRDNSTDRNDGGRSTNPNPNSGIGAAAVSLVHNPMTRLLVVFLIFCLLPRGMAAAASPPNDDDVTTNGSGFDVSSECVGYAWDHIQRYYHYPYDDVNGTCGVYFHVSDSFYNYTALTGHLDRGLVSYTLVCTANETDGFLKPRRVTNSCTAFYSWVPPVFASLGSLAGIFVMWLWYRFFRSYGFRILGCVYRTTELACVRATGMGIGCKGMNCNEEKCMPLISLEETDEEALSTNISCEMNQGSMYQGSLLGHALGNTFCLGCNVHYVQANGGFLGYFIRLVGGILLGGALGELVGCVAAGHLVAWSMWFIVSLPLRCYHMMRTLCIPALKAGAENTPLITQEPRRFDEHSLDGDNTAAAAQLASVKNRQHRAGKELYDACKEPGVHESQSLYIVQSILKADPRAHAYWSWWDGRFPLHWAAFHGDAAFVSLLLQNGAMVNLKDYYAQTAAEIAAREGHEDALRVLIAYGIPDKNKDACGDLLRIGVTCDHKTVVGMLIDYCPHVMDSTKASEALLDAARSGLYDIVGLLLSKGVDSSSGKALAAARSGGHQECVDLLDEARRRLERARQEEIDRRIGDRVKIVVDVPQKSPQAHPVYDVFISFRFSEAEEQAFALQRALAMREVRAFVCSELPGANVKDAVVAALASSRMAIILGTRTYGTQGSTKYSTKEELTFIIEEQKPFFLVKMCERFEEALARISLGKDVLYYFWSPTYLERSHPPEDLIEQILIKLETVQCINA